MVQLNLASVLPNGVFIAIVGGPNELQCGSEALVPQSHGGVDDIFSIAADDDESPVGVVTDALRVEIGGAQILEV